MLPRKSFSKPVLALLALGTASVGWYAKSSLGADPGQTEILVMSVGQGDCALFRTEGHSVLIDSGPATPQSDAGERIVVPKLRNEGVRSVDWILISHPDMDHVGGTGAILAEYPMAHLAISAQFRTDAHMLHSLGKWGISPSAVSWLPAHSAVTLGGFRLRIECPFLRAGARDNDGSMFVQIAGLGASAVFSGDAPMKVEEEMLALGGWQSQVLHCGHHGSATASGDDWLESVRPDVAVISVGRGNHYGHPHRATLGRLRDHHIPVLRTDRDGDLRFLVKGGRFVRG